MDGVDTGTDLLVCVSHTLRYPKALRGWLHGATTRRMGLVCMTCQTGKGMSAFSWSITIWLCTRATDGWGRNS